MPAGGDTPAGRLAITSVIVLAVAFLVPVLGWLVGVALVVASGAWSARDKLVGLLLGPLPFVALVTSLVVVAGVGSFGPVELFILMWSFAGLFSAPYLRWRLASHAVA